MARGGCCPLLLVLTTGDEVTETRIGAEAIGEPKEAGDETTGVNSADRGP